MKFLLVTQSPPYPPTIGGNQRTSMLFKALSKVGQVDLLICQNEKEFPERHKSILVSEFSNIGYIPQKKIKRREKLCMVHKYAVDASACAMFGQLIHDREYDVIMVMQALLCANMGLRKKRNVIIDIGDVEFDYYLSYSKAKEVVPLHLRFVYYALYKMEWRYWMGISRDFKNCLVTASNDQERLALTHCTHVPNVPYAFFSSMPKGEYGTSNQRTAVFVGSLYHKPNRLCLHEYILRIWPKVRERFSDAKLLIIGPGQELINDKHKLCANTEWLGCVKNVEEFYALACYSVGTLRVGAGTNIKVLESYYYGVPIVATEYALRGYEDYLRIGWNCLGGNSESELIRASSNYFSDPDLAKEFGMSGQRIIREAFSASVVFSRVQQAVMGYKSHE